MSLSGSRSALFFSYLVQINLQRIWWMIVLGLLLAALVEAANMLLPSLQRRDLTINYIADTTFSLFLLGLFQWVRRDVTSPKLKWAFIIGFAGQHLLKAGLLYFALSSPTDGN